MNIELLIVGLAAVAGAWDIGRRMSAARGAALASADVEAKLREEIGALERRVVSGEQVTQAIKNRIAASDQRQKHWTGGRMKIG